MFSIAINCILAVKCLSHLTSIIMAISWGVNVFKQEVT
jgi:hypothetical protein